MLKVDVYRLADVWRTTNLPRNGFFGKNQPTGVQDDNIVFIHSHSRCQGSENVLFVLSWKLFCLNLRTLHRKCSSTEKTRKDKTNIYLNTEKWPLRGEFVPTFWVAREVQCKKDLRNGLLSEFYVALCRVNFFWEGILQNAARFWQIFTERDDIVTPLAACAFNRDVPNTKHDIF